MLAVITDDYTGAAEIGGVAIEKGLQTIIEARTVTRADADVLVIASNMRSLAPERAHAKSRLLTEQVLALGPELIFKKVDSVLRGNIGPELAAQMQVEKKGFALLVPANPSRGRIVVDGTYYVDGVPLAESSFARNHDFGSRTSRVVDILRARGAEDVFSVSPRRAFTHRGVYIGNAQDAAQLGLWAGSIGADVVPAGGAEFFSALLEARVGARSSGGSTYSHNGKARTLFICGSNFPLSRSAVAEARSFGFHVVGMPDEIYFKPELDQVLVERWAGKLSATLKRSRNVIITATQTPGDGSLEARNVSKAMALVTRRAVEDRLVDDLMIEGGETAQAILSVLNIGSLYPVQSLAPGVTRMKVDGYHHLHVTMKPGSYGWPDLLWRTGKQQARAGEYG